MLEKYIHFINTNLSDVREQTLLLAISGGVDSMVMLDMSIKAKLNIAVAHVNHKMRDSESDKDAELVRKTCYEHDINYYQYDFSDEQKTKANFQENARNIRYQWMNELCSTHGFSAIFTAHHNSDSVETFFINLMRGSGLNGLSGIPTINGNVIRPLMQFEKSQINQYAIHNDINYRVDQSNHNNKYRRNLVRNEWLPILSKTGLDVEKMIGQTIANLRRDKSLLEQLVRREMEQIVSVNSQGYYTIDISDYNIDNQSFTSHLMYHYLRQYNFTYDNVSKCLTAVTGSVFLSDSHELLKDRNQLILRRLESFKLINKLIENCGTIKLDRVKVTISNKEIDNGLVINNLEFPFIIRTWKNGDRFQPSGMEGASKKVKDYLTDLKLDSWTKKSTLILEKNNEIVAVLPYRVAEGFNQGGGSTKVCISVNPL